jgi:hypothetical protein
MGQVIWHKVFVRIHEACNIDVDFIAKVLRTIFSEKDVPHDIAVVTNDFDNDPERLLPAMARGVLELSSANRNCPCFHVAPALVGIEGMAARVPISITLSKSVNTQLNLGATTLSTFNPPENFMEQVHSQFQDILQPFELEVTNTTEAEQELVANFRGVLTRTLLGCVQYMSGRLPQTKLH